jgi:hypothetical protein
METPFGAHRMVSPSKGRGLVHSKVLTAYEDWGSAFQSKLASVIDEVYAVVLK